MRWAEGSKERVEAWEHVAELLMKKGKVGSLWFCACGNDSDMNDT